MDELVSEYPKWIEVDGPGHPAYPGHVLVENKDEERAAKKGKFPASTPDPDPAPVDPLKDQNGDAIAPDVSAEANKPLDKPGSPDAKSLPASDARPDDAKNADVSDKPAGNVTESAAKPLK